MNINTTVSLFGIGAAIFQTLGYISYYKYVKKPNAASWLIWFYGNLLVLISYLSFTKITFAESLPVICATLNIVIVIVFFIQKKFSRLDKTEKVFVAIDIAITILWLLLSYNSYMHGIYESLLGNVMSVGAFIHIILLVSSIDSFFPIIRDTIKNPDSDEHHYPWVFWSLGYAIWFVADFLRFYFIKDLEIWSIFYPIVYFMLHATLATILFIKDRKKRV